ncbi:MAG: tyrosine-type recombinase/integrase, partial [Xanthomonadales bacterium]|nr:tyrosine-type recombinase/integrase [Xanthomonadales bacterium]
FPDLAVDAARRKAEQLNSQIAEGENPAESARSERSCETLAGAFELYYERHARRKKRSHEGDRSLWRLYLSKLGSKRLNEIRRRDIADLHAEIGQDHPAVANRVLNLASSVFGRLYEWDIWTGPNPCKGVRRNRERPRDRYLRGAELRRFLAALDAEPCDTTRDLMLIALLTGARQGNVLSMRWEELDLDEAEWIIPAHKHKGGDAQILPLAPEAVVILRHRFATTTSPWVFPALRADSDSGHYRGIPNAWKRILLRTEAIGLAELIAERRNVTVDSVKEEIWQLVATSRSKHAMKRSHQSATDAVMVELREEVRQLGLDPAMVAVRDLRMHDLRRTLASWQMKTGATLYVASQSLGHKDLKTTTGYARLDSTAIREAMHRAGAAMLALRGPG